MDERRWYKTKGRCRRMFLVDLPRFYAQNRISHEKLSDFNKKITSIRWTVQKLCNFCATIFSQIHKVKNSRKSGVKSHFCKGHFHANWVIAKLFQNFENIFPCFFLMWGSNLLWYMPPSRHFTKTRYCRVKSLYTGHFTLKFRVKYAMCLKAKMWIPLPPRGGCVWQQIWTTH